MSNFFADLLSRLSIMLPVVLVLSIVLWLAFNRRRFVENPPAFSAIDMRTWPLRFALLDGAAFAGSFALFSTVLAESSFSAGVSGGLAAIVAMGIMPWLANRHQRQGK